MDDAECKYCCDEGLNEISEVAEENADIAADETEGESMETDDVGDDVYGNCVHSEPNERLSPASEIPDFDELKKDGQENCGKAASDEDVGGGPEEFYDRE